MPQKRFQIFLGGLAVIGKKSFLITAPNGYLKRALRYANQNLDQPSAFTEILHHLHLVTASTEIAATGVNGIVLQTGFHHPIK